MSSPVPTRSVTASAISPTTNKRPDCFQVLLAVLDLPTCLSASAGLTFKVLNVGIVPKTKLLSTSRKAVQLLDSDPILVPSDISHISNNRENAMKTSGFWAELFGVCAGVALVSWAMKLVFKLPHLTAAEGGAIAVAVLVLSKLHDISDNLTASRRLLDERLPRAE